MESRAARVSARVSSPYLWRHDGLDEIVVTGTVWLKSCNLKDGQERWKLRGLARVANASATSGDGLLFASSWNIGADARDRFSLPPWAVFVAEHDKDKNGSLTKTEFPLDLCSILYSNRFGQERDGYPEEWRISADFHECGECVACRAAWRAGRYHQDASGLETDPWLAMRSLGAVLRGPRVCGEEWRHGFMLRSANGPDAVWKERLGALGDYYASPVAGTAKSILPLSKVWSRSSAQATRFGRFAK
jgi:hypothetical protein